MAVQLATGYAAGATASNLFPYSERFDNWFRVQVTVSTDVTESPNGGLTADKVAFDSGSVWGNVAQNNVTLSAGAYSVSFYAKAAGFPLISLVTNLTGTYLRATFDLVNGEIEAVTGKGALVAAMEPASSGWFRCTVTGVAAAAGNYDFRVSLNGTGQTGDGVSGIYLWGGQLNAGARADEYIRTLNLPRSEVQPGTHARILWDNLPGTISADNAEEGFAATNAGSVDTVSWWMPTTATGFWRIDYAAPQTVDAVGVGAHDLAGVLVVVFAEIGGSYVEVARATPEDNSALLFLFPAVEATGIGIYTYGKKRIGVVYTGVALAMLRRGYAALGQLHHGRQSVLTSYVSEGGQLLARFVQRRGLKASYSWEHLPEDWYNANFDAFTVAAQTEPFFIGARPVGYPEDCGYVWVDQVIIPQRMGVRNWLAVAFEATGHADA